MLLTPDPGPNDTPGKLFGLRINNADPTKTLVEMNRLTVELYQRRSNPDVIYADTPKLVERLKKLSKRLNAR